MTTATSNDQQKSLWKLFTQKIWVRLKNFRFEFPKVLKIVIEITDLNEDTNTVGI